MGTVEAMPRFILLQSRIVSRKNLVWSFIDILSAMAHNVG
jgi:hypothetical protein